MGKRMTYGPKFHGGTVDTVRGTGFIQLGWKGRRDKVPKHQTFTEAMQNNSLAHRKKKGIVPSMPTFSWDTPKPEPAPKWKPIDTYLSKLELLLPDCTVDEVLQAKDDDPYIIVAMRNKDGKPFNACFNRATGSIPWLEGPNRPTRRCRNLPKRKDC